MLYKEDLYSYSSLWVVNATASSLDVGYDSTYPNPSYSPHADYDSTDPWNNALHADYDSTDPWNTALPYAYTPETKYPQSDSAFPS